HDGLADGQVLRMDTSVITALAALAGAAIGGLTSVVASWLTQHSQAREQRLAHYQLRPQNIYKEFIELEGVPLDLTRVILLAVWLSESIGIDSPVGATTMPKALSGDLRERIIEAVEAGASRREAAERFEISASSAVKWLQRWRDHGVCAP